MSGPTATQERLIDRLQRSLGGRQTAAFAQLCAPDIHYEDPFTGVPLRGVEALSHHLTRLWSVASDVRFERSGARLAGNNGGEFLCAPIRVYGTHNGDVSDSLPATGRRFDIQVLLYIQVDVAGTRLERIRAFFDAYRLAIQLGVLPEPGGGAEKALLALRGFGVRARRRVTGD